DSAARSAAATDLERGRDAYARRAWADAHRSLASADQLHALEREDLERLAWSAALIGLDQKFLEFLERLYHAELEAGRAERAARWAFWQGFRLLHMGEAGRG